MKKEIREILNELYELDSSLKKDEKKLVSIIEKMLLSKPKIKIDDGFKNELKQEVLRQASKNSIFIKKDIFKYLWVFASWAFALALVVNIYPNLVNNTKVENINIASLRTSRDIENTSDKNTIINFKTKIEKVSDENLFWDLVFNESEQNEKSSWIWAWGWIWWGWLWIAAETSSAKIWIMQLDPDYKPNLYLYNISSDIELPEIPEKMYVYKKTNESIESWDINFWDLINTDIIDISKLRNLNVSNINLSENISKWYNVNFSFKEWVINIFRNYNSWPEINYSDLKQLTLSDIPSDEKILWVVNKFIEKYNIDVSLYSDPIVDDTYSNRYISSIREENLYISDVFGVTFPLELDWVWVYEYYGNKYWLNASVNIRDMAVSNFWVIEKLKFQWSEYDLETSREKIEEIALNWNYSNKYLRESWNYNEVNVDLWNPKLVYLRKYIYNEEERKSEEFFIPWILFEVLTKQDLEKWIYPWNYVWVPLVWKFVDNNDSATIMPLVEPRIVE